MQWIKDFVIACIVVLAFSFSWLVASQLGDMPWVLSYGHEWSAVGIGVLIAVVGAICGLVLPDSYKIIAAGIFTGAVVGVTFPLAQLIEMWFRDVSGFWSCLGVWFVYVVMLAASVAGFVAAFKNFLYSVFRFDFVMTLLSFAAGITMFYIAVSVVIAAFDLSAWVGIGLIFGLSGGSAGYSAPNVDSSEFMVSDGRGNYHFILGKTAGGYSLDTDGNTLRQRADGTYEKIH